MKQDWRTLPFEKSIVKVKYTTKIASTDYLKSGLYPIISQEEGLINGYWNNEKDVFKVYSPIIVFGDHTRILKYVDFDFVIGADGVKILQPINKINAKFLKYYIESCRIPSLGYSRHYKLLKKISVPIPPMIEQERIVAELDLLSDVIAKKREQLKQLDALAQSIFYDMFGDPFLMSNAKESVPLGSICVINPHKSELKNIDKNTLCSFVGMAQIGENGELTLEHNRAIKDVYKGFTFFREGDVLFAKITPCMENGKGAIAKRLTNKIGFGSTEFHVIRPNNKITDKYIYYLLSIPSIRKWAESKMTGAGGQRRVPTSFFDELRIILPSLPLQQQFASKIESIEKQKELIKQSLSEVQQLFDSRMDYYFN